MDDIGIATQTNLQDHIAAVKDVLCMAKEHDLYFKPEKCMFHKLAMDYLGVILEKGVTHMDLVKVASVHNWPTPTCSWCNSADTRDAKSHIFRPLPKVRIKRRHFRKFGHLEYF